MCIYKNVETLPINISRTIKRHLIFGTYLHLAVLLYLNVFTYFDQYSKFKE